MNTINNNNIYFGQRIPTKLLLKCSLDSYKYQDVKELVLSQDTRFPGHLGYAGKAMKIVNGAIQKNEFFADFVNRLKQVPDANARELEIEKFISKYGTNLDIEI